MPNLLRYSGEALLAAVLSIVLAVPTLAQDGASLQALLDRHRCAVVEALKIIHATFEPRDRFLTLSVAGEPQAYVQCLFLPDKRNVLCEASSGYYRTRVRESQVWAMHPARRAQLAQLGFDTHVTAGNYPHKLDFGMNPDFERVADLMLSALYHGYGARRDTRIGLEAPLLPLTQDQDIADRCTRKP